MQIQLEIMEREDLHRAGLEIHVDQRDQHEHRAEEGIQEELDGGVHPVRPAPDADDDEHRDQHRFPEHVEKHRIQGGEHADHHTFHHQEGRHVLRRLVLDDLPAGDHHQDRDKGGKQDQRHRDAVHTQVVVNAEGRYPGHPFHELHLRGADIKASVQRNTHQEGQHGKDQRQPARNIRCLVATREHQGAPRIGSQIVALIIGQSAVMILLSLVLLPATRTQSCWSFASHFGVACCRLDAAQFKRPQQPALMAQHKPP